MCWFLNPLSNALSGCLASKLIGPKVKLSGARLTDSEYMHMASILDCSNRGWPNEFLGLALGGSPGKKDFWDPVVDRCKKELTRWKANYLSFGGRITLTKATLSNLPIYFPSLFRIPKGLAAEIERLQNQFL